MDAGTLAQWGTLALGVLGAGGVMGLAYHAGRMSHRVETLEGAHYTPGAQCAERHDRIGEEVAQCRAAIAALDGKVVSVADKADRLLALFAGVKRHE